MSLFTITPPQTRGYSIVGVKGDQRVCIRRFVTAEALRVAVRLRSLGWTVTVTS